MRSLLIALLVSLPLAALAAPPISITLEVQNMTCEVCPITVKKALQKVPGVNAVTVDFDKKTATVTFDPDQATYEALTKATMNAGYPSTVQK
ncbi:mercury resistance system periplasmic binding protein MerP [Pseudomonas sp. ZB1P45]|uniref:mercury resistance system periplasmic binding protein MerP n=1 Tax=Pseudomonas frigoris TaxID=3398356 RepID=UPI0039EFA14E